MIRLILIGLLIWGAWTLYHFDGDALYVVLGAVVGTIQVLGLALVAGVVILWVRQLLR